MGREEHAVCDFAVNVVKVLNTAVKIRTPENS